MISNVFIEGMRIHAFHGVDPQERAVGSDFVVTLIADFDISRAAETDDVADTVDYAALYRITRQEMAVASNLVEHVARRIAYSVHEAYPAVTAVHVKITKVNPPMGAECVGAGTLASFTF